MLAINVFAQNGTSSKGTEFWTAYVEHVNGVTGDRPSQMALYITSDVSTTGTVSVADGSFTRNFTVTANQVSIIAIPPSAYIGGNGTFLKGIYITAEKPIAVYAHIYAMSVSGATLLLPVNTMGKEYFSINYTQDSNQDGLAYSLFNIIGTEDNTTVEIIPAQDLSSGEVKGHAFTITLQKGEVYQARSLSDLTGSRIRSISVNNQECKKIAVFSGTSKIGIGCPSMAGVYFPSDNVFQQVYPTAVWGKDYYTVPLAGRNYDIFRIVLSDRNTNVRVNGITQAVPASGPAYIEFKSTIPNVINADKPIQVAQYAVTQGRTLNCVPDDSDLGDPEMIFLNPVEQTINKVTLYSTSNYLITRQFINVVIKTSGVPSFRLDNAAYTNFQPLPGTANQYSYAQIRVNAGTHNITADEGFNAIVYGFGQYESYGYSAGTNLQNLNEYVELYDPATNNTNTAGCTGVSYNAQLTIPYQPDKIIWDFKDGSPVHNLDNPNYTSTFIRNGVTLYVYKLATPVTYTSGNHKIVATTYSAATDVCGTRNDIQFDFNVSDFPEASFKYEDVCLGDIVQFTDMSDPKQSTFDTWLWDFGDGTTSGLQNPEHTYASPGIYTVKLTVSNVNGCTADVAMQVEIVNPPGIDFTYPAVICADSDRSFTATTPVLGDIKTWVWNFGDGTPELTDENAVINHLFASPGTYTVTLAAYMVEGCYSPPVPHTIIVHPKPVPDFILPDVCVNDAFAQFTDNSSISDNAEASFTYSWNFGDSGASAGNPNTSTQKDPRHKYSQPGDYTVTLTISSGQGCPVTISKTLTVNGDVFSGTFSIENSANLCSGNAVVFKNDAAINVGSITRVEWYFDLDGHPGEKEVFNRADFPADGKFYHTYDLFNTPFAKTYRVQMVAYSGNVCFNAFAPQQITVNAAPLVTLTPNNIEICSNDEPLQISQETNGFTGTGTFTGTGITASGLFNPGAAGAGTHTINYTFVSNQGCSYTTSFDINVIPAPVVTVKPQYNLFEGERIIIDAQATGSNLTYQWTPAFGLSNATVLQPEAFPPNDTQYTLTVTSSVCTYVAHVFVKVLNRVTVPNAFTPNGDGYNDTWGIKNIQDYPDCMVKVFNRYGTIIYSSKGYAVPWDGTQNGAKVPVGVYYYIIDLQDGHKPVAGNVTVLK